MNWMTILWPVVAGACLALAFINLLIAVRNPPRGPYLFFALSAFAAVGFNGLELAVMRATDVAQYDGLLKWSAVPTSTIVACLVGFVASFFGTDRRWLGVTAVVLCVAAQVANFISPAGGIRHVIAIHQVQTFGGVSFTVPTIVNGPWDIVEMVAIAALIVFVLDASIALWRRGGKRRAVVVGGSIIVFFLIAKGDADLVDKGYVQTPYLVSFAFVGVLIAMGYELSDDVLNAAKLSRKLTEAAAAQKQAELQVGRQREEIAHLGRVSMMGQLSSAIAHELDQPLGAILRNAEAAELYLESDEPDLVELRGIITDIRTGDQRACAVIRRLRALFKRRDIAPATLAVSELLDEVIALTHTDAATRHVTLDVKATPGVAQIWADRVQVQQVLLNLLLNAMDAVHDLPIAQRVVTLRVNPTASGFVEITVSDRGQGIAPEKLAQVFEPFFTTKETGTGMGLVISRAIVEAHGGVIEARNNDGAGATFRFTLPVEMKRSAA